MGNPLRGLLIEYGLSLPPLVVSFEFNPETLSRTRSVTVGESTTPANRGGYSFDTPAQSARAAVGVSMDAETLSVKILLDATDRMNEGEPIATISGIQPEIDTLRSMVEPKIQTSFGMRVLSILDSGSDQDAAFTREFASVIIFVWGIKILPVFITSVQIDEQAHLPSLLPYRAEATLQMQIIESDNPFYKVEVLRQMVGSALNVGRLGASIVGGVL